MKIEGTDAASFKLIRTQELNNADRNVRPVLQMETKAENKADTKEIINISQLSPAEIKDLPIAEKVVIEAIEKANKAIIGANRKFEFSIHEKTKEIVVKVINSDTNEIIREIPNEKILDMVARMWEMAGLIVDERR